MEKTGESYAAARREVIREFRAASSSDPAREPERFAISYQDMGPISTWADTLLGGGPVLRVVRHERLTTLAVSVHR